MKTVLWSLMLILIAGCANHPLDCATGLIAWDDCIPGTKGYEIRQQSLKNFSEAKAEKDYMDDAKCRSFGATPGSDAYVNCRVQLGK